MLVFHEQNTKTQGIKKNPCTVHDLEMLSHCNFCELLYVQCPSWMHVSLKTLFQVYNSEYRNISHNFYNNRHRMRSSVNRRGTWCHNRSRGYPTTTSASVQQQNYSNFSHSSNNYQHPRHLSKNEYFQLSYLRIKLLGVKKTKSSDLTIDNNHNNHRSPQFFPTTASPLVV